MTIATTDATIIPVTEPFDAIDGAVTPFGTRWGGDIFRLTPAHLAALQAGQTLALDVQSEYIVFLQTAKLEQAIKANPRGLGYGD